ncbi:hypothetical protein GE061_016611 [Apolygus lucorum]|uniref:Uncharacterized protein n=1 Tax=Apolygus lucorum TaxID=248454 RepID=A0A8S9XGJ1_APOLU|nr:hypothetical protein GE061_016611 [Apolygus lucorum]
MQTSLPSKSGFHDVAAKVDIDNAEFIVISAEEEGMLIANYDGEINLDFALNSSHNMPMLADSEGVISAFPAVASTPNVPVLASPLENINSNSESSFDALIHANPQEEIYTNLPFQELSPNTDQKYLEKAKKDKGNLRKSAKDYAAHIKRKEDAQNEKNNDKAKAQGGEIHAIVCDLMKVQCLPMIRASAAYYKLKLAIHNFTIYNMGNKDVMAYWFDETNANLQATTFASFLVEYISDLLQQSKKPVVIISDGCGYQHRNSTLSNALLHLSISSGVVITRKFLEVGHTYSEGDSVHARIEGSYENLDVHLPSQFVELSKKARKNPFPYRAKQIDHGFVRDYNQSMIYPSIRPGRAPGDPTVTDLRLIQYNPTGIISYKINYSDELSPLPQRPRQVNSISTFPPIFKRPLTITLDKYKDLQSLKPMLPNDTHAFYDSLPHDENSQREAKRKRAQEESSKELNGSSKRKKMDV